MCSGSENIFIYNVRMTNTLDWMKVKLHFLLCQWALCSTLCFCLLEEWTARSCVVMLLQHANKGKDEGHKGKSTKGSIRPLCGTCQQLCCLDRISWRRLLVELKESDTHATSWYVYTNVSRDKCHLNKTMAECHSTHLSCVVLCSCETAELILTLLDNTNNVLL